MAGHKRYAALQKLGHAEIRAEVRSGDGEHSERAAENVVRTQLNPYEPGGIALMPPLGAPSPWLFPGNPPSRPIGEQSLSRRLKQIGVDCRQNRRSALMRLAGEIPAAILSEIVGVHVKTAANWADIAGRSWGDYPNLRGLAGPAG